MSQTNNPFGLSDDTMRLVELLHQSQTKPIDPFSYASDNDARFDDFKQKIYTTASNACLSFMISNKQNVVITYMAAEDCMLGVVTLFIKAIGPHSTVIKQCTLRLDYNVFCMVYSPDTVMKAKITETVRRVGENVAEAERKAAQQRP